MTLIDAIIGLLLVLTKFLPATLITNVVCGSRLFLNVVTYYAVELYIRTCAQCHNYKSQ